MLQKLNRKFQRWLDDIFERGRFRDYEQEILIQARNHIGIRRYNVISSQIPHCRRIQREIQDRIVSSFFKNGVNRCSEEGQFEIMRGSIACVRSDDRPVNFRVWMFDGLMWRFEFSRSPVHLEEGGEFEIVFVDPPWPMQTELAMIVDRQEHGPDPEVADAEDEKLQRS